MANCAATYAATSQINYPNCYQLRCNSCPSLSSITDSITQSYRELRSGALRDIAELMTLLRNFLKGNYLQLFHIPAAGDVKRGPSVNSPQPLRTMRNYAFRIRKLRSLSTQVKCFKEIS